MRRTIRRRFAVALIVAILMMAAAAVQAQPSGMSVTCDNGATFDNGVEVIVNQMRSGFTYTATAIGLNGFDPVLAVLDERGNGLCSDDTSDAARYSANLPTSGRVNASGLSSQVTFAQTSGQAFHDVSLVVGGFNNASGEFLLILEGMAVTSGDGAGDPFSVNVTPGMVASGVPLTAYMLTRGTSGVDPLMFVGIDGDVATDDGGAQISCDDAGTTSCWGSSAALDNYNVTINTGTLPGWQYDSMLSLPLNGLQLSADSSQNYFTFYMTSYQQQTEGQYLVVFHIGTTATASASGDKGGIVAQPTVAPTPVPPVTSNSGIPSGMSVTCDNGATFDNGVEVIVNQMRSGFTYTATAIGLNGFDPVLAVLDERGNGLCSDDTSDAARYSANLPTSGRVNASGLSSQVTFAQTSGQAFHDVSLVVGGFNNASGEFLLILEGMAVTSGDGAGDPFSVNVTPGMVASGVPLTAYMLTRGTSGVDPLMFVGIDGDVATDDGGAQISCDDAGTTSCWGSSAALDNYNVTINTGTLPGWQYDSMLSLPLNGLQLSADSSQNYFTFYMTSYQQQTEGQYLVVFHIGTSPVTGGGNVKNSLGG